MTDNDLSLPIKMNPDPFEGMYYSWTENGWVKREGHFFGRPNNYIAPNEEFDMMITAEHGLIVIVDKDRQPDY